MYTQREKRLTKEASLTGKRTGKRGSETAGTPNVCGEDAAKDGQHRRLQFADGVLMMEAVIRNDVSEGNTTY